MDLDEFLKIHENKLTKDKKVLQETERRPTQALLSNLLEHVKSRENKKRSNECLNITKTVRDEEKQLSINNLQKRDQGDDGQAFYRSDSPTFEYLQPVSRNHDAGLNSQACNSSPEIGRKKSNRKFVPDDQKDDKYWERRRKNNEAAKKSRKDRRKKELEVYNKMSQLEIVNSNLVAKIAALEERNKELESLLNKYKE